MPSAVGVSDGRVGAFLAVARPDGGTQTGHQGQLTRQPAGGADEGLVIAGEASGAGGGPWGDGGSLEDSRQRTAQRLRNFPPLVFKARTSEQSGARDPRGLQSGGPEDWGAQTLVRAGETVALDSSFFFFARFFG